MPRAIAKRAEALLEQQMWCWGCDVRRKEGNLLTAYGCERDPAPEPRFRSAYRSQLPTGGTLSLWGWGVWMAREDLGSLFLSRSRFLFRHTPEVHLEPKAWQKRDLPTTQRPAAAGAQASTVEMLLETLTWIGAYERWLASATEPRYREAAIAAWPQRRRYKGGTSADAMASEWMALAQALREDASAAGSSQAA